MRDFPLGAFGRIGAVNQIEFRMYRKIAADRAGVSSAFVLPISARLSATA